MKKILLAVLVFVWCSAFTDLSSAIKLTSAGLQEDTELQGQKAIKFSEGVTFNVKGKELSSHIAFYIKNKTLLAEEFVVLKTGPGQVISADKFTYNERKEIGHFSGNVQVKAGATTSYQALDYNFKTGKIQDPQL
ncbi:hypothetical protein AAE02nite_27670 [Adhaeribacter aerolatus]|uniref:Organic solvent tolerance-like N-terminal domain-containing protein n=1 Tax=Adhaeribacter aerolatus TaxID=670289 RepID=A0A512AZF6_9BACT|nr:hypothetical protein [Adhaeribacter aerolatus]GEO05103.1 hypothetical protein AAE02nite_27670 [Adhaeribacter aerolatus]